MFVFGSFVGIISLVSMLSLAFVCAMSALEPAHGTAIGSRITQTLYPPSYWVYIMCRFWHCANQFEPFVLELAIDILNMHTVETGC